MLQEANNFYYELVERVVELVHAVLTVNVNAYGGNGGTAPFVFNLGTGWSVDWSSSRLGGFIPGRRLLGSSVGPHEPISNRDFVVVYFGTVG